jgi:porphobilinogen synthase
MRGKNMMLKRPRRLRSKAAIRGLVRETAVQATDLIYPMFIVAGSGVKREIPSLPGVFHFSVDRFRLELAEVAALGIPAVLLFGAPDHKDELGSGAYDPDGLVQRALRAAKQEYPDLLLIADVCLCEYTSHGHCGIVANGRILNDPTLELLSKTALSYAAAGADIIAPSDMMDGRVRAIRETLEANDFTDVAIMSYSVKYASAFYGPFREAAGSTPAFGDRRSYQMDYANRKEARHEVELDVAEGADIVMVKPALAYLDIIREISDRVSLPVAAYQVSGEYAMIKAAARQGWIDEPAAMLETVTAIKRAGAKLIITYFAKELAKQLVSQGTVP